MVCLMNRCLIFIHGIFQNKLHDWKSTENHRRHLDINVLTVFFDNIIQYLQKEDSY